MADDGQFAHVITALHTYEQVMAASPSEAWKRSARMNLDAELAKYQHTSQGGVIEELRAVLRDVRDALTPEQKKRVDEALGELKVPPG